MGATRVALSLRWVSLLALAALGASSCTKAAPCRPGTLLVTLDCGGATAPGGADHALFTLKEGTHQGPTQNIPLKCPLTTHEVTMIAICPVGR